MQHAVRPAAGMAGALAGILLLTACAAGPPAAKTTGAAPLTASTAPAPVEPSPAPVTSTAPAPDLARASVPVAVRDLTQRQRPDVLVLGKATLSPAARAKLAALSPKGGALSFRAGQVSVAGLPVAAAGVDPSSFRAFAAQGTAEASAVWQAVARGEVVASHAKAKELGLELGEDVAVTAAAGGASTTLRLGALATTGVPGTDLLLDEQTARSLGLASATAMLLTAGDGKDPIALADKVRAVTGKGADVDLLTPPAANPVAFLSGSRAARAFGAFSYRYFPDGTIEPDARWVRANIRTEPVPIMGTVTCHRLMLPQLRGALQEVLDKGLDGTLHHFDGCYVPRFIERNPERSISLHTWGIAIDMDAATNYRGIAGTMDPEVVNIFKRWGFRWGGDWSYTDPMHFELAALLSTPRN